LKHLAAGSDLVLLPTAPKARSVELTVELASLLKQLNIPHAVLLVKVDFRQRRIANEAREALEKFDLTVLEGDIPLLSAFDKAENQGSAVIDAVDDKGRSDPRRMSGWSAYCSIAQQIQCQISKHLSDINKRVEDLPLSA
jgi:chromosome partitioning protein